MMYSQAIGTGGGRVLLLILVVIWKLKVPFRAGMPQPHDWIINISTLRLF